MESPPSSPIPEVEFDGAEPFKGVVVCCTSIPPDHRTEIAQRTSALGGVHKYDLTPDVTHLIVGEYDTPKYRHVARERPDVKPMGAGWIDAVRDMWMADTEIDFPKLESEYMLKTFETSGGLLASDYPESREPGRLLCCLTGFEDQERHYIEDTVKANGGNYIGDLSRRVTHLIVCKPEGKKYQAAKNWNIRTVSLEWLTDSVSRGMILEETCYDPILPKDQRGKGAVMKKEMKRVTLGKRLRDAEDGASAPPEEGRRKLRKTASLRINGQGNNLWGDVFRQSSANLSRPGLEQKSASLSHIAPVAESLVSANAEPSLPHPSEDQSQVDGGIFSKCRFFVYGFPQQRTDVACEHLISHGGRISTSLPDITSPKHEEPPDQRFLMVPQNSQPESHPLLPDGVHIVTEFYIERCMHNRELLHPNEHVLGRPFPRFPIDGFHKLTINSAGFENEQLNQVEKSIVQLGAKYTERLNKESSLLVCPSIGGLRKSKLDFAILSNIPVVHADWLWQCIAAGFLVPWDKFLFPELEQRLSIDIDPDLKKQGQKLQRSRSEPVLKNQKQSDFRAPPSKAGIDASSFGKDDTVIEETAVSRQETDESHYETAPTRQVASLLDSGPLAEVSTNALNKSPSPPKQDHPPRKPLKRFPTEGTVADSEGGDDSQPDAATIRSAAAASVSQTESTRKRKAEEQRNAERQALATRLTSLMNSGDDFPQDGNALSNPATVVAPRPQRRKREILGRAVSNTSAASTASAESSAAISKPITTSLTGGRTKSTPGTLGLLDGMLEGNSNGLDPKGDDEETNRPAATQVGYDNPEARRHRAVVMDRMLGNKGGGGDNRKSQEKVTMESLKGETMQGLTAATAASRRPRRR
ncbi:BRCT domain-containing protein [Xylariales sp. AK1849]|nr:BRCT domain-containing protein [Xylariales sp. AK1849]